jgi:hypothetical protein
MMETPAVSGAPLLTMWQMAALVQVAKLAGDGETSPPANIHRRTLDALVAAGLLGHRYAERPRSRRLRQRGAAASLYWVRPAGRAALASADPAGAARAAARRTLALYGGSRR